MTYKFFFKHILPYKTIIFISIIIFLSITGYLNSFFLSENDPELFFALKIGIITSLIGSIIFLLILAVLKPSFAISKNIALCKSNTYPDMMSFTFKIVNKSWFFNANDVKIRATHLRDYNSHPTKNKKNYVRKDFELTKSHITSTPRRLNRDYLTHDPHCEQIGIIQTKETDLLKLLDDDGVLELEITAKHSLSGFSGLTRQKYYNSKCIIKGTFEPGDTFYILED